MIRRFSLGVLTLLLVMSTAQADDWPQFRGPDRSGVSQEKGLLTAWPKAGPKLLWKFKDAGLGFTSMAIVGDIVYLCGTRDDKEEIVIALDANADKDGKVHWTAPIGPLFTFATNKWGDGPRGSPTIDGNFLYTLSGQGDLICLDRTAKGKEVWRTNLAKNLEGELMTYWGFSESPLIDGNLLICTPGGNNGTVAALDKKTGQVKWRSADLKNRAPYSSIVPAKIQGVRQYLVNSYIDDIKGGVISGISAADGAVLWTMSTYKGDKFAIASNPVVKDNFVYISVGEESGRCHLFEIAKNMKAKDKYPKENQKNAKNGHGGVVLVGDHVYGISEKNFWFCQDLLTGDLAWTKRDVEECQSGSIIAAGDMLYLYSDQGEAVLLKADPKAWTEAGRFTIPERSAYPQKRASSSGSKVWSHPAIANGRLYLRDCEFVYCYDISAKK